MSVFKVKIDTYWVVRATNKLEAIDYVADSLMEGFLSDYDSFDVEEVEESKLSEDDRILLEGSKT